MQKKYIYIYKEKVEEKINTLKVNKLFLFIVLN